MEEFSKNNGSQLIKLNDKFKQLYFEIHEEDDESEESENDMGNALYEKS